MTSQTRATLLEQLRDGANPLAWDEFFDRYWRLIFTFARRRGCADHTAEEIVQEVMVKVFQQRDVFRYDPRRGRFRDWLGMLVRNQVAEYRRRPAQRLRGAGGSSVEVAAEVEANDETPDAAWQSAFEQSLLGVLLDVLRREMNPRDYLAFELLTLGQLAGAEVAKITGLTRNAAYKARKRACRRLGELGLAYRNDGQLGDRVKQALQSLPPAAVQRSLTTRFAKSMLND
ncbi:MAG: sigma-70 family RNA polymerase sigma factor [Pirellulales bacterium]|nr:sigma-70 family RNA polymerase sigma factor [Pirellulales bacterium]